MLNKVLIRSVASIIKQKNTHSTNLDILADLSGRQAAKISTQSAKIKFLETQLQKYQSVFNVRVEVNHEPNRIDLTSHVEDENGNIAAWCEATNRHEVIDWNIEQLIDIAKEQAAFGMYKALKKVGKIK